MRKTTFIFAGIMSAVIGTAYATGENVVASKSYVDTKQVKIPVAGTNAATPGESVVTYTDTAGTIGERGIFSSETGYDNHGEIDDDHLGDLVPAEEMEIFVSNAFGRYEANLEPERVVKTTCSNPPSCTLWEMQDVIVHKITGSDDWECMSSADCDDTQKCSNHTCVDKVDNGGK